MYNYIMHQNAPSSFLPIFADISVHSIVKLWRHQFVDSEKLASYSQLPALIFNFVLFFIQRYVFVAIGNGFKVYDVLTYEGQYTHV